MLRDVSVRTDIGGSVVDCCCVESVIFLDGCATGVKSRWLGLARHRVGRNGTTPEVTLKGCVLCALIAEMLCSPPSRLAPACFCEM